ncbi:hypothetical protein PFISCL1PPCAC_25283 [Pristionchus fissidentatus]|uniref:Uncharacterized protein n=1 Tax=Pristionchus fissidentatus TaxID=1538716 RepID=A0AAV5WPP4_9BILA|nr:hypothetical protein PFISCL1PPCAC_25283 [Pristionchus fissidentatus]
MMTKIFIFFHLFLSTGTFAAFSVPSPPGIPSNMITDTAQLMKHEHFIFIYKVPSPAINFEETDMQKYIEAAGNLQDAAFLKEGLPAPTNNTIHVENAKTAKYADVKGAPVRKRRISSDNKYEWSVRHVYEEDAGMGYPSDEFEIIGPLTEEQIHSYY